MCSDNVDNNGQTALHFTASKNHLDIARKLIASKATTRKKDKRQQLPLHRAAAVGSVPMIKLFLENRAKSGKLTAMEEKRPMMAFKPVRAEYAVFM